MTRSELKPLYTEAAARARIKPSQSELAVWVSQLGDGDIRDLQSAINRHFTQSQWMPKESELKPLIEQAQKERLSQIREAEEFSAWECNGCKTKITSFKVGFSPQHCKGYFVSGPDKGKACSSITFRLLYRGASA